MGKEKITSGMQIDEIAYVMSEGLPGALQVVLHLMSDIQNFHQLLICDALGIRGSKLYMLYNDCCDRNYDKFSRTLEMLSSEVFNEKQIEQNFDLVRAIPFIDDDIKVEGMPPYGERAPLFTPEWEEYCNKNKQAFEKKLAEKLNNRR